jgi:hypothetical protein
LISGRGDHFFAGLGAFLALVRADLAVLVIVSAADVGALLTHRCAIAAQNGGAVEHFLSAVAADLGAFAALFDAVVHVAGLFAEDGALETGFATKLTHADAFFEIHRDLWAQLRHSYFDGAGLGVFRAISSDLVGRRGPAGERDRRRR